MGARARIAVVAGACAALLGGCGSGGSSGSSRETTRAAVSTSASSPTAQSNGEAAKSSAQILSDIAAALRTVHSYHLQGAISMQGGPLRISLTISAADTLDFAFAEGGTMAEVIDLPGASYVRANRAFWRAHLGARGARLAGRWLQLPESTTRSLTRSVGKFTPATLARCLVEVHGTVHVAGTGTVAGKPVVVLKDAGDAPGSSPSSLDLAATGPPYPLRIVGTGRKRPGGRIDVCNDGKASDSRDVLTFSQFNQTPPIQAPAAVASPGQVQGA